MTWRQRLRRAARPFVQSVARGVRGDSEEQGRGRLSAEQSVEAELAVGAEHTQAAKPAETEPSAVPAWGLLPSQVPPRVELLRGDSSIEILRGAWGAALYVSIVIAVVGTVILLGRDDIQLVWIVPVTLLSGGAILAFRYYRAGIRTRAEHRAGYTVLRRKAPDIPQVDAMTGYVIRPAGAPELSKQQQDAAVKRVREIGRFVARHPRTMRGPL
jgi:hypothetical protein